MLLRYITLNNFRQYLGEQKISFSCNKDKNVTVILGDNTSGKTTLIRAFNWCLYGNIGFKTPDLLNEDIAKQMKYGDKEYVTVEIGLTHDDVDYKIIRTQEYICQTAGEVRPMAIKKQMSYLRPDGQTKTIDGYEIDNSINRILPEGLSSYFFFEGERVTRISDRQDVAKSVKGLMGLDVLEEAKDHLSRVVNVFSKNLDLAGNEKALQAKSNLESQEKKLEIINKDLENIKTQIEFYQQEKEKAAQELRDNQDAANKQREKEQLDIVIVGLERDLDRAIEDLVKKFNKNAFAFFGQPLLNAALESVCNSNYVIESITGMNADSIQQIIDRGFCVCGTKVEKGSKEEFALIKEKDFVPPKSIGTYIAEFKEVSKTHLSYTEDYFDDLKTKYMDVRRLKKELARYKDERDRVSESLVNQKDTKKLEENHINASKTLKEKESERSKLEGAKGICENEIRNYQKAFDSFVKSNEKNTHINTCIEYSKEVLEWANERYSSKEATIREMLELKVNSIFGKMYHGHRTTKIDKNYKVYYTDVTTDESTGLEMVRNFAFIAGLVDLAREKVISKVDDEFDINTETYPLIIDAPFSSLDSTHVNNISKVLSETAEQVIMVVVEKDWKYAQIELANKIGMEYRLKKESETLTSIDKI